MTALKTCLEAQGYTEVKTVIASGNVIVHSEKPAKTIRRDIEALLPKQFKLDSELVKVLVLTPKQIASVIKNKPKGFGETPSKFHSDAIFLIDITLASAMKVFQPKEGVDAIWKGKGVIYSRRLSAKRTHSRLGKIVGTAAYKCMTIRSWNTTVKLHDLVSK